MADESTGRGISFGRVGLGSIGRVVLALYLLLVGVSAVWGEGNIPAWVAGALAFVAGALILVGV
jgi:hypothetical protein